MQSLSGDLDRILAKALSIAPRSRYSSPAELAEDLDRHLNGQPIRARGRAPLYRLRRGLTRHRTALAVVLVIAASLVWALRASFHSAQRAEMALVEAQQAREESEAQGNRLRELCIRFLTELGPSMQGRKGLDEARRYLLYVGANLLDYLREAGYEDRRLRVQIARSYAQLADADWMARDRASQYRTPDSVRKAREVAASLMPPGDDPLGREIMEAWARSTRSAVWFASYEQNLPELRQWVADADALLTASGRDVNSLSVIIDSMRMEWRRTWLESELKFEEAMEAWDVARLRSKISTQPDLAPFLLADLSRMESLRAELLVRDYREEEALFELPTLVYQLRDEARSHQPPIRDLSQAECNAWVLLALARARSGLSPGDAVDEGLDSLRRFEEALDTGQSSSEAGALLHMAFAECYWTMGPENLALATGHLETSIEQWKQLLRSGARWPQYQLKLVAALELLARIQRDGSTVGSASRTLAEAYDRLGDLPSPASDSPIAVWLRLELDLIARSLPDQQERAPWAGIQERLADLERRGISSRWLLHARRQIQDQQEREQR
ncbi:MAG: hypothetical protein R3F17_04365 [Planctomycetota bacterium]